MASKKQIEGVESDSASPETQVEAGTKTITIAFKSEADLTLYESLKANADADERTLPHYVLRKLRFATQ